LPSEAPPSPTTPAYKTASRRFYPGKGRRQPAHHPERHLRIVAQPGVAAPLATWCSCPRAAWARASGKCWPAHLPYHFTLLRTLTLQLLNSGAFHLGAAVRLRQLRSELPPDGEQRKLSATAEAYGVGSSAGGSRQATAPSSRLRRRHGCEHDA
jgi:hypothetical protein